MRLSICGVGFDELLIIETLTRQIIETLYYEGGNVRYIARSDWTFRINFEVAATSRRGITTLMMLEKEGDFKTIKKLKYYFPNGCDLRTFVMIIQEKLITLLLIGGQYPA